jgi:hypothetical protein
MPTERMKAAVNDLNKIQNETEVEMNELHEAIDDVETIHQEHMKEMKLDEEFINDLKTLYKEIRAVRKIEQHMKEEVKHYENGDMSEKDFKKMFVKDENKFEKVVQDVRGELEDMVTVLSNEERLTNKDLEIEDATQDLVRKLNGEEEKLEEAHSELKEVVLDN